MRKYALMCAVLLSWGGAVTAQADTITFGGFTLLASSQTSGLLTWDNSWTWNGKPAGPGNEPTEAQLTLQATINLYAQEAVPNVLYVQVTNVSTTTGAWWFGSAFDAVLQTGVELTAPLLPSSEGVGFSGDFANPGEILAFGGSTESTEPLTDTPGYQVSPLGADSILIQTTDGTVDAFTSLCCIEDATVIRGGGVFQLTFAPSVNLFQDIDPGTLSVASQYGAGRQYIEGSPVPEPCALAYLAADLLMGAVARRRHATQ